MNTFSQLKIQTMQKKTPQTKSSSDNPHPHICSQKSPVLDVGLLSTCLHMYESSFQLILLFCTFLIKNNKILIYLQLADYT